MKRVPKAILVVVLELCLEPQRISDGSASTLASSFTRISCDQEGCCPDLVSKACQRASDMSGVHAQLNGHVEIPALASFSEVLAF